MLAIQRGTALNQQRLAARNDGLYTPPSTQGTAVFPMTGGGVNWGSSAYDPTRHLLFMNTNRLATLVRLIPHERLALEATQGTPVELLRAELALQASEERFRSFAEASNIPVSASFRCQDIVDNRSDVYVGDSGIGINPISKDCKSESSDSKQNGRYDA